MESNLQEEFRDSLQKGNWYYLLESPTKWSPEEYDLYDPNDMRPIPIFAVDFEANGFAFRSDPDQVFGRMYREVNGVQISWNWKERVLCYQRPGSTFKGSIDRADTIDRVQRILSHIGLKQLANEWVLSKKSGH